MLRAVFYQITPREFHSSHRYSRNLFADIPVLRAEP